MALTEIRNQQKRIPHIPTTNITRCLLPCLPSCYSRRSTPSLAKVPCWGRPSFLILAVTPAVTPTLWHLQFLAMGSIPSRRGRIQPPDTWDGDPGNSKCKGLEAKEGKSQKDSMFQNLVREKGGTGAQGRQVGGGQTTGRVRICFSMPWEVTEKCYTGK